MCVFYCVNSLTANSAVAVAHVDDEAPVQYGVSAGIRLSKALATAGTLHIATEDAVRYAPAGVAPPESPYPAQRGWPTPAWIIRLRRGLYAGTGQLPGGVDVPAPVVATALVSPSALAHWSALAYHDLTDQVPVVVTLITPKKVVTPSMRAAGSRGGRHLWRVADIECQLSR